MDNLIDPHKNLKLTDRNHRSDFQKWLGMHGINELVLQNYLVASKNYSKLGIDSVNEKNFNYKFPELDVAWKYISKSFIFSFPSYENLIENVRDRTKIIVFDSEEYRPHAYTDSQTGQSTIKISYKNKASDLLDLAHEFSHCLQFKCIKDKFVPPVFRESAAFVGEQVFLRYISKRNPDLHLLLIDAWYKQNTYYLKHCAKLLGIEDKRKAAYSYEWNYPIARVFSVLAFDNYIMENNWKLFSSIEWVMEQLNVIGKSGHKLNLLSLFHPCNPRDANFSLHSMLGIVALLELKKCKSEELVTVENFCKKFGRDSREEMGLALDYLLRPAVMCNRNESRRKENFFPIKNEVVKGKVLGSSSDTFYRLFGHVIELLSVSNYHKNMKLFVYFWREFLPPYLLGQIRLYVSECDKPIAMVSWAKVSEDIENRLKRTGSSLGKDDWCSGARYFFNDIIAPYNNLRQVVQDVRQNVLPEGTVAIALRRRPDGSVRKVSYGVGRKPCLG